jgi:hypothetical protein
MSEIKTGKPGHVVALAPLYLLFISQLEILIGRICIALTAGSWMFSLL